MRVQTRVSNLLGLLATIVSTWAIGHGYDNFVRHDLSAPANLAAFASASTSDGGLWLLAAGSIDKHQLVRLDADGNRTAVLLLPTAVNASNADQFSLYPLPDGGVLTLDTNRTNHRCIFRRISRDGVLRFSRDKLDNEVCSLKLKVSGLAPYLLTSSDETTLIDDDGALIASVASRNDSWRLKAVEFAGSRELLFLRTNDLQTGYLLSRSRDDGSTLWSSPLVNVRLDQNVTVRGLSDGRAMVLVADATRLQVQTYSTSGTFISASEIAVLELSKANFGNWTQDSQGNHAVALRFDANASSQYGAAIFAASGALLKQVRYPASDQCPTNCALLGLAQGFAAALRTPTGGKLALSNLVPNAPITQVQVTGAFHAKIAQSRQSTILMTSETGARAFNLDGTEIAAPSMLGKGLTQTKILAASIADDGKSFVMYESNDGQSHTQLEAFAADGARLWRRTIGNMQRRTLLANSARVCFVGHDNTTPVVATLACFASASGVELNAVTVPELNLARSRVRFLSDGALRVVFQVPIGLSILDISTDNELGLRSLIISQVSSIADLSGTGDMLITKHMTNDFASEWLCLNDTGAVTFSRLLAATTPLDRIFGRIIDNEPDTKSLLLIASKPSSSFGEFDAALFYFDGALRWSTTIASKPSEILFDSTNIYLNPEAANPLKIQALAINDGHSAWNKDIGPSNGSFPVNLQAATNPNEVLISIGYGLGTQLTRLESAGGAILEQRMLGCESASCAQAFAVVDAENEFRTISLAQDSSRDSVVFGRSLARISPEIALDQIGISGAWYTPAINGQGLFLEYFPQNKLLFAPWFTYSSNDSETSGEAPNSMSASNLRWYTLTGSVVQGATGTQLEIRRNIAGKFDSVPVTTSKVVGSATLRATDCNQATLAFAFNSDEAPLKSGVLPLERLSGGSAACQLSSGEIRPGRDARPARGGFDGRQSGSWYQPQTAGQGLMMTVQPATATAPGFFFGGWFTYDAGTANDPTTQHWLTLSGEIPVNAQSGVVPVAIYRTLGGQLASVPSLNNAILGHGTVTFSGCAIAVLRYQFDDLLIAGAFRARTGEINLQRLGDCPAQ